MMLPGEIEPKSVYQIYLLERTNGRVIFSGSVAALTESEAIVTAKVGSIIEALGFTRDQVEFYIGIVAHRYEGKTFRADLEQKPPMTSEELDAVLNPRDSLAEIDDLKARVKAIEAKITSA